MDVRRFQISRGDKLLGIFLKKCLHRDLGACLGEFDGKEGEIRLMGVFLKRIRADIIMGEVRRRSKGLFIVYVVARLLRLCTREMGHFYRTRVPGK